MDANARQFPQKKLDVKLALEDGNLVAVFSHVRHTADEPGFAVVHILRFENSRIVEMWDLAQQVPAASPNANGMF
jgi:predicted SnoaL-like aldol condensation-catalyzing enzyme